MHSFHRRAASALACLTLVALPSLAAAQARGPAALTTAPAIGGAPTTVRVLEGTEFPIRVDEALSSSSATDGDRFTISLDDDVTLADGVVLHAGYRGVGEVVEAQKNGMLGKSGKLNIRLVYLKVGDDRIRLRASKGAEGDVRIGATVAAVILFWPVAPFIKGKEVSIRKGTIMRAYAEQDTPLTSPVPPPPKDAG